jgi:hypothetical protein
MTTLQHSLPDLPRAARVLRDRAGEVLNELLLDRALSDARREQSGQTDPLKHVTGSSSMDKAVDATRQMIEHLDELAGAASTPSASVTVMASPLGVAVSAGR